MKLFKKATLLLGSALMLASVGAITSTTTVSAQEGTITFINHKTDWEGNGKWDEYIAEFNEIYPDVEVKIETITDYAGQIKTRMNTEQYGDVLMLPADINPEDFHYFFEPLGDKEELSETYLGLNDRSFDGVQYGIPTQLNATGMVVNFKVFEDAGITEFPTNTEDFIAALATIKENNPEVTPLYTNYAAGWTLSNWDFARSGVSGNPDFTNELTTDVAPFEEGKTMNEIYKLLFDVANQGLIEADPTTTDWEQSKVDLANGKIAVMVLGSWAVPQIQEINPDTAENIAFFPFPMTAEDGNQYLAVGGDYNLAINVHSENKEAARTFLDWLINDSNYAEENGGISPVIGAEMPASLANAESAGVLLLEENPAEPGKEALFSTINDYSQLGVGSTDNEKQRIIDAAVGNTNETFEDMMAEFNARWAEAIEAAQ